MRARKVFGTETACIEQRHGQRVTQRHLRGGAGGGCQIQRAGFALHAAVEHDVGIFGERGFQPAGHRDQRHALALEHRQQHGEFVGLAAVGDAQHQIALRDHAQIAVAGFRRVHEERRRAGGGQRRGDLATDMAALAHAHDHHATGRGENSGNRIDERISHTIGESHERVGLISKRLPRQLQGAGWVERMGGSW